MSRSPPTPSQHAGAADTGEHHPASPTTPSRQPSPLNLNAAPFSPSTSLSRVAGKELPEWLLFSPSSSEGRSPASGRFAGPSLAPSFAEVVHGKGKSPATMQDPDLGHSKGKEPMDPGLLASSSSGRWDGRGRLALEAPDSAGRDGGFMADAHRASAGCHHPSPHPKTDEEGWHLVTRRKQWRRLPHQAPPPHQPRRLVPADLVGRCFNYLRQDHVAAECPNATRCLRCHKEGHCARICKRPRSPDAVGPRRGPSAHLLLRYCTLDRGM
jgi:hypothetical protein